MLLPTFKNLLNNIPLLSCFYHVSYVKFDDESVTTHPNFPLAFEGNKNASNDFIDEFIKLNCLKKFFRAISLVLSLIIQSAELLKHKKRDPQEIKFLKSVITAIVVLIAIILVLANPLFMLCFAALALFNHSVLEPWLNKQQGWGDVFSAGYAEMADTSNYLYNHSNEADLNDAAQDAHDVATDFVEGLTARWNRFWAPKVHTQPQQPGQGDNTARNRRVT